ncbi:MAG: YHYH protein [Chloroflexi bacterium]|nr:MAG: YHYH protein [Chloroflexota bacterium]
MKNMLKVPEYAENSIAGSLIDVWQCTAGHEILVQDLETDYIDDIKCSVTIVFNSDKLIVKTTGIPNHDLESGIGCCASEQSREWSLPLNPIAVEKDNYTMAPDRGPVAVAVNGAAIYGPEEGPGGDAVALEYGKFEEDRQPIELGICGGHSGPGGEYHYHYDANCIHWHPDTSSGEDSKDYNIDKLDKSEHSPVIGFAFDGYPIYGFFGFDNNGYVREMTSSYQLNAGANGYNGSDDYIYLEGLGDLDRCNGHFGVTPDFPNGEYHYHSTIKSGSGDMGFPYFIHCYHGVPDESNFSAGQGMEPGGRPPGGRPPGGRPPPRR